MKLSSTGELFEKGLVKLVQVQNESWTPQIVFKSSPFKFCPWLINDLGDDDVLRGFCSLHPHHKPLICKMAPAGREVDFLSNDVSYMLTAPTENCPGMNIPFENKLSDLKTELKEELDYEIRFYKLLEVLQKMHLSKKVVLDEYYIFEVSGDFNDLLTTFEKKLKISDSEILSL